MPNLDLARSLAVLSVVLEHILLGLGILRLGPFEVAWFGVLGVLVFFVLTCLVLMWSLDRRPNTLDFYIRRVFRIYPLAALALFAVVVFHAPTGGSPQHMFVYNPPTIKSFLMQITLLPGVGQSLLGVMWSLPYEMAMYLLLPALYFFSRKNMVIWSLLAMWILTVWLTLGVPANGHNFAVSIGYFLPGVMAYVGFERWKPLLPGWALTIFLVVLWIAFWHHASFHRGWLFCLIFGLALPLFHQIKNNLVVVPSRIIARYSYGIYLTHPFAIVVGLYVLHGRPAWMQAGSIAVLLVVLPVAAYHLIEHPMVRLGARLAKKAESRYEQHEALAAGLVP